MLPVSALVQRAEVTGAYVFTADGRTVLRQLRLGHRVGERVEVLAGLASGDRVATAPLEAARHAQPAANGATS
jgi:hypothetical protein